MKKFIVYSDTHILAPHDTGYSVEDMIKDETERPDSTVVLTGDIIDRENAKKNMIQMGNGYMMRLLSIFGDRYIYGNHEGRKPLSYIYIDDETRTLFLHGHTIFWSEEKVEHWENKKLGQSKWKYRFYKLRKAFARNKPKHLRLSNKYRDSIIAMANSYQCTTVVFGHSHRDYDVTHGDVRIINVPQGRTVLWI